MSDIENAIKAAGADKAPRITPDDIEANIVSAVYFTGFDGFSGSAQAEDQSLATCDALRLLTFCVLVLRNGFTVTGVSACASPENFNAEIGKRVARENAVREIWPLMGYALKEQLFQRAQPAKKPMPRAIRTEVQENYATMDFSACVYWDDSTYTVGRGTTKLVAVEDAYKIKENQNV